MAGGLREADIQKAILDWLSAKTITHWRCSLGGVMVRHGGRLTRTFNPMKGFPDIAGIVPDSSGQMFTIEVKRLKYGKWLPEQLEWREKLEARGVLYIVATSVEDVRRVLESKRGGIADAG